MYFTASDWFLLLVLCDSANLQKCLNLLSKQEKQPINQDLTKHVLLPIRGGMAAQKNNNNQPANQRCQSKFIFVRRLKGGGAKYYLEAN